MDSETSADSLTQVSFLNLFGILVTIILMVTLVFMGGHTLKYIKAFACKVKIIMNRAVDKGIQLKEFNYSMRPELNLGPAYHRLERIYKNEVKKSRSLHFCTIFKAYLAKYNHLIYYPFRNRVIEKYDLLKPKATFFNLLAVVAVCVCWMISIFFSTILQNSF